MDPIVHLDDARYADDNRPDLNFTRHGSPVTPMSPEDDIRSSADAVVQSVPLPEFEIESPSAVSSSVYGADGTHEEAADINSFSAEDIHESSSFDV